VRIIGGTLKGRYFSPPNKIPARPTTDIAKEGLFNVLENTFYFEDKKFLDLFAGTGNISYEIFSRGCMDITSVDMSPQMTQFIQKMSNEFQIPNHKIIQGDAMSFVRNCRQQYDIIFAGPPYPMIEEINLLPDLIFDNNVLSDIGWFILETSQKHDFNNHEKLVKLKNYGQTHFWIFSNYQDE
jgi:16S rRNA (guanine(966)-N(2))-methyltransferase RsmD